MKMLEVCCKRRARKLLTCSLTAVFTATVGCLVRCLIKMQCRVLVL